MTPGQWEFTMTTKGVSRVSKSCMTPELAAVANGDSVTGRQAAEANAVRAKSNCAVKDFSAIGDIVSYTLTCGERTIRSVATHHGDRYEGTLKTKTPTEETTTIVSAHRIGACSR